MYGRFKSSKGYATRRTAGIFSYRRRSYLRKVGNKYVSKKSRIGYKRSIEKKYNDRAIAAGFIQYGFGNAGTTTTTNAITSVGFKSSSWYGFNFNQPLSSGTAITQDLTKGIGTGTSTTTRVGNKVKSIYMKGSITLTANQENNLDDQGGEEIVNNTDNGLQYLRTSWRVVIVKDTQSNSTDPQITWDQVFASGAVKSNEEVGGINSELNIGNMGRFIILKDMRCELSAERPQATVPFFISGSSVGEVRYNNDTINALTDKGIYIIAANQSTGLYTSGTTAYPGMCAVQSRFCFTDS